MLLSLCTVLPSLVLTQGKRNSTMSSVFVESGIRISCRPSVHVMSEEPSHRPLCTHVRGHLHVDLPKSNIIVLKFFVQLFYSRLSVLIRNHYSHWWASGGDSSGEGDKIDFVLNPPACLFFSIYKVVCNIRTCSTCSQWIFCFPPCTKNWSAHSLLFPHQFHFWIVQETAEWLYGESIYSVHPPD